MFSYWINPLKIFTTGFFLLVPLFIQMPASGQAQKTRKPMRVALVIGDQWDDPMSYVLQPPFKPGAPEPDAERLSMGMSPDPTGEFYSIMLLLKSWGIPFDVHRLDQQFLNRNMFLNMDGSPKYGTILWLVNRSEDLWNPDYSVIERMVNEHGISLIGLGKHVHQKEIQSLLGFSYQKTGTSDKNLNIARPHDVTEGITSPLNPSETKNGTETVRVEPVSEDVRTVIKRGDHPQVTVRDASSSAKVAWIGGNLDQVFAAQGMRTLFRETLTWTTGFMLYKTWESRGVLYLDDPGTAQNAWLDHWHYPSLTEQEIQKHLIRPLKKHDAVLTVYANPGFVNDAKRRVEPAWQQTFTDAFGVKQNYVSTKKGLDRGIEQGVFSVNCHGLTHMQPDLTSPPGWWGSELDGERAQVGWYREFADLRRGKEIPAAEQRWRMKTAQRWMNRQFGSFPIAFAAGGMGVSLTYRNNTARVAGRAGFGWFKHYGYLGEDVVFTGWKFENSKDAPLFTGAPPDGHDFGITRKPEAFLDVFETYPDMNFISIRRYVGYLHAEKSGVLSKKTDVVCDLSLKYDPHYCQYFRNRKSTWKLDVAGWCSDRFEGAGSIVIDGNERTFNFDSGKPYKLTVPEGTETHNVTIK